MGLSTNATRMAGWVMRDDFLREKFADVQKLNLEPTLYGVYIYLELT